MLELKPCPFCGKKPELFHYGKNDYSIKCMNRKCGVRADTITYKPLKKTIAAWNKRVTEGENEGRD